MIEWRKVNVCEACGWAWLPLSEEIALHCPSRKCRAHRNRWNASGQTAKEKQSATPEPVKPATVPPPQAEPSRPRSKPSQKAKPVTRSQVQPRYHLQIAASLPTPTAPDEIQPPPVRLDQQPMQAASPVDESERLAQIVKTLSTPHKVGDKCPHGWASWFQCPTCNSRR